MANKGTTLEQRAGNVDAGSESPKFAVTVRNAATHCGVKTLALLLACVSLWVYRNSLDGEGVLDDDINVAYALSSARTAEHAVWNPRPRQFAYLSLVLNHQLGGLRVRGYHQFNRFIHLANALLLFGVVGRTLRLPSFEHHFNATTANWLAWAVALIWLVHPLQSQAVSYIVQRMESMMALCYLAGLYCLLRGATSTRGWVWYAGTVLLFWTGIGTKEIIATAPLVMVAFDRIFLAGSWREVMRRRGVIYLIMIAPLVLLLIHIAPYFSSHNHAVGFGHPWITPWMYARTQAAVIIHYLRLAVWPDQLCLDYCWPVMTLREVAVPAAILLLLLSASVWALFYRPRAGFLAVSFFLILAPTSSFVPINDLAFEHRMYLPMTCVVTLCVFGAHHALRHIAERRRWTAESHALTAAALVIVVAVPLALRTIARNNDYRTAEAMWRSAVAVRPHSHRAQFNLGAALLESDPEEACIHLEKSFSCLLDYWPDRSLRITTFDEIHRIHRLAGVSERSRELLEREIRRHPDKPLLPYLLGRLHRRNGELESAVVAYERTLELNHNDMHARRELAMTLLKLRRGGDAAEHLRILIARHPDSVMDCNSLAWILATYPDETVRDGREAVRLSEHVCLELKASDGISWATLAGAYAECGDFENAVWASRRAIKYCQRPRDPGSVEVAQLEASYYEARRPYRMNSDGRKTKSDGNTDEQPTSTDSG